MWISTATQTLGAGLADTLSSVFTLVYTILWDLSLVLVNLITPGKSIPNAAWPEYVPREASDSRSPCPGLNALSNHGILPHDGRDITFKQLGDEVVKYYNFSPSLSFFVAYYLSRLLKRNYRTDTLDLSDICVHNGIVAYLLAFQSLEHDGSMTRHDTIVQHDQSIPAEKLIGEIFAASTDGKTVSAGDWSRILTARLAHSKRTNGQFTLTTTHALFGAGNAATLLKAMGGEIELMKPFLLEERIPEGWMTQIRSRMGLTIAGFNRASLGIFLGMDPSWKTVKTAGRG